MTEVESPAVVRSRESALLAYSEQFKTQGNREGKFWFLGIEEGGGGTVAEVDAMLDRWESNRRDPQTALRYPEDDGAPDRWFDTARPNGPPIQTTWGAQIRVLLAAQGLPCDTEDVRRYQAERFGTPDGDTCLMELLPLPNPRMSTWTYRNLSSAPQFRSRGAFIAHALKRRVAVLEELVAMHQPDYLVGVCYGMRGYLAKSISDIAEEKCEIQGRRPGRALTGMLGNTVVAITYHPGYRFSNQAQWYEQLGRTLSLKREQHDAFLKMNLARAA